MFYSEFGEDKELFKIFEGKKDGVCVDVGANHGIINNNSFFFEKIGWTCVLVEPIPALYKDLCLTRPNSLAFQYAASNKDNGTINLHIVYGRDYSDGLSTVSVKEEIHKNIKNLGLSSYPIAVKTMTLNKILTDAGVETIDFISIDVEGHEYETLEGFSIKKWMPAVILIEDNSNFSNNCVCNYLRKFDYIRFRRTGVNDWYAHRTNKQLVNLQNKMNVLGKMLAAKVKNKLRKIPILMRIKRRLYG